MLIQRQHARAPSGKDAVTKPDTKPRCLLSASVTYPRRQVQNVMSRAFVVGVGTGNWGLMGTELLLRW